MRDHKDSVKAEAKKVGTKIDEACRKLAKKMRERANKAKSKMDGARNAEKRAVLLRRFNLCANAATFLEEHLPSRHD